MINEKIVGTIWNIVSAQLINLQHWLCTVLSEAEKILLYNINLISDFYQSKLMLSLLLPEYEFSGYLQHWI